MSTTGASTATNSRAGLMLGLATLGFALCFWAWALLSPLAVSFTAALHLTPFQQALLVAVPVVVGSLGRIPVGALTDRFGGRVMFPIISLVTVVPVLFLGVGVTVLLTRKLLPWTHDVSLSPFEGLLRRPVDILWFGVVVVVAGGIREEVQRAFLLRRFESSLGGSTVGLVVVSVCFGLLHKPQGWDAAIATGALGFTWGWLFLRRRSAVAPIVSHAGYDLAQILQAVAVQSLRV